MADRTHLYTKTQLRDQFRLKPGPGQQPASRYWQGHGWVDLYDTLAAVPMRPLRAASTAQSEALAAGRALAGTLLCACGGRGVRAFVLQHRMCSACWDRWRTEEDEAEQRAQRRWLIAAASDALTRGARVLDVETTGLDDDAEIIEIALVDAAGVVLFESLVRPVGSVTPEAFAVHGISDAMLTEAPRWPAVYRALQPMLNDQVLVSHNVPFEQRLLTQDCRRHQLPPVVAREWVCTMELATPLNGGRWPNLSRELALAGVDLETEEPAHRALADARRCLALLRGLANLPALEEPPLAR